MKRFKFKDVMCEPTPEGLVRASGNVFLSGGAKDGTEIALMISAVATCESTELAMVMLLDTLKLRALEKFRTGWDVERGETPSEKNT